MWSMKKFGYRGNSAADSATKKKKGRHTVICRGCHEPFPSLHSESHFFDKPLKLL